MAGRKASRGVTSRDQWAAQVAALNEPEGAPRSRREPITAARIVAAALAVVEAEGYDALTMRRVAAALRASPGALYAHVRDKSQLDDLMIGELCSRVMLPEPDPAHWRVQALEVCRQLRDQYLRYPEIWRATLGAAPLNLDTMRITEGLLAIVLSGGVAVRTASWAVDSAFLYTGAYSVMALRRTTDTDRDGQAVDRAEIIERFKMLPAGRFPILTAHADELISGEGNDQFDFTLGLLFGGLTTAAKADPQRSLGFSTDAGRGGHGPFHLNHEGAAS